MPAIAPMSDHYDALETRDPAARERAILERLPRQVAHAKAHAPAYARLFADVDAASIVTRGALARLRTALTPVWWKPAWRAAAVWVPSPRAASFLAQL